jgi:glycosyltransferase involved in cell wall biosynthesis
MIAPGRIIGGRTRLGQGPGPEESSPLLIAIDGGSWSNRRGYGRFVRDLTGALAAARGERRLALLVDPETADRGGFPAGIEIVRVAVKAAPHEAASAEGRRSFGDLWAFRRAAAALRPDVVFVPTVYSYFPVAGRTPTVVGFLDAIAETLPELVFPHRRGRFFWTLKCRAAVRRAARIFTISESSRRGVAAAYGLSPAELLVVPCDVDREVFHPKRDPAAEAEVRAALGLAPDERFFLAVGGLAPHKNLERLIRAFAVATAPRDRTRLRLVLVGGGSADVFHSDRDRLAKTAAEVGVAERVLFPGFVPDDRLAHLYRGATALCFPSLLEGFGLPALEAMACGTAVVVSDRGSLPEVAGDVGVVFPAEDVPALAAALGGLLDDPARRDARAARGPARAALFRREDAARALFALFDALVRPGARPAEG